MELERTFSHARKPPGLPSEERSDAADDRRFQVADDTIDSFPREDSPYARALLSDDLDALDRARADEPPVSAALADLELTRSRAASPLVLVKKPALASPARTTNLALAALAILAVIGWGAFLYERMRPIPVQEGAPSSAPAAGPTLVEPLHPLPARAFLTFAPMPGTARAATAPAMLVPATRANISGTWTLTRAVESSSYNAFTGMTFRYELRLQQKGDRVTGSGRRVSENGKDLARPGQVPLRVQGTIAGDTLVLNFTEGTGSGRRSGRFQLVLEEPGILRGRFSSNAASSKGTAEAQRSAS